MAPKCAPQRNNHCNMQSRTYLKLLLPVFTLLAFGQAQGQVTGLSYTLQPSVSYDFFDGDAGLEDAFLYGGNIGFGFGQNVELRGLYMRSTTISSDFADFTGIDNVEGLQQRDVDITRYGGEIKLNLAQTRLLPYLAVGAGIQEFDLDKAQDSESIYASLGLGVTFSIFDRLTLNLEGRTFSFSGNAVRNLLTADDRDLAGIDVGDFDGDRVNNWSLGAGLEFYLGGRNPNTLSDIDRAYSETFQNGFRNVSLLVEPTLSYIDWDDGMPYVDTYLGGASLGLDFGPLVGARVFYYRSMEDEEINASFDDLSMYGADFRFRFSSATTGVSPFLTVGGGYIDVQDDYRNAFEGFGANSQGFATGGGGISFNITRTFRLTGAYRALLTTSADVEDVSSTDQIRTSNQFTAGINLAFGKKAKRPEAVFTSTANARLEAQRAEDEIRMQAALADQARENKEATNQIRADYELKMMDLKDELDQAEINQDTALIADLEAELEETEEVLDELEDRTDEYDDVIAQASQDSTELREEQLQALSVQGPAPRRNDVNVNQNLPSTNQNGNANNQSFGNGRISLSPAELENLIEEIFEGINDGLQSPMMMPPPGGMPGQPMMSPNGQMGFGNTQDTATINQMQRQIDDMNSSIEALRTDAKQARENDKATLRDEMNQNTKAILDEIRDMRQELNLKSNMSDRQIRRMDKDNDGDVEETAEPIKETRKERRERRRREREEENNEEGNN